MTARPNTVGEILERPASPRPLPRNSVTVRKLGNELNRAVEIKRALQEHDDPKLILDMIEGETDLAEACLVVLEETMEDETLLAGVVATIKLLQERKSRLERSIETRRGIILMAMEKAGLQTIKGALATLAVRETPPKTVISDEALIPARFWKPSDPKLDRAALAEALKAKEEVPGASLSNGGVSLNIRVR
jgi:hypothetical protein